MNLNNIIVKDTVFDPDCQKKEIFYYKGHDGKIRYKVWLYLEGIHLFYVDTVIYNLHNTFKKPIRKINRTYSNEKCSLIIWTWGIFKVDVTIYLKTNEILQMSHELSFENELHDTEATFKLVTSTRI